jgi:hypothetical protein
MKLHYIFTTLLILSIHVQADEHDDYSLLEFAVDAGTGFAIASCEADPECADLIPIATFIGFTIGFIIYCISPQEEQGPFRLKKAAKRTCGVGTGYFIGKCIF